MFNASRRRSVWQVLGFYAVASWLVFQVALALRDGLGLPDGLPRYVAILLVIGLPIVLATAFVQHRLAVAADARRLAESGPHPDIDPTLHPGLFDATMSNESGMPNVAYKRFPFNLLTWKRSLLGGVGAFTCLMIGTTGFMAMRHHNTLTAQGMVSSDEPVLLADFDSPRDSTLGVTVTEALRVDLQQSDVLHLAQPTQINSALTLMRRDPTAGLPANVAIELAKREGLKAVITGNVSRLGTSYVLVSEVRTARGDSIVASFRATARDSLGLIDAVNTLSKDMRGRIGESLKSLRASVPLDRATTSSLPALEKYVESQRVLIQTGDAYRQTAILKEAVAIDSTFAEAWRKLYVSLRNSSIDPVTSDMAINRAYALRNRLSDKERLRIEASYAQYKGDHDGEAAALRSVLEIDRMDGVALHNLGSLMNNLHRYAEAEQLYDSVETCRWCDHDHYNRTGLISVLFAQGRTDEAKKLLDSAMAAMPDNATMQGNEVVYVAATGHWEQVDSIARALGKRFPDNPYIRPAIVRAERSAALIEGRLNDGRQHSAELAALNAKNNPASRNIPSLNVTWLLARLGHVNEARQELADAMHRAGLDTVPEREWGAPLSIAQLFVLTRQQPRADHLLNSIKSNPDTSITALASLNIARGRAAEAIEPLRRASSYGCDICDLPNLARAYDALGQTDSAIAIYERYLTIPSTRRLTSEGDWRPIVLLRVAELHEAAGDKVMALKRYGELLQLWRHADPVLAPNVDAVKQRVAALMGKG